MWGHDLQWWIDVTNTAYVWALVIGAISAVAIATTSFFVIKWQTEIQVKKDAEFEQYKIEETRQIEVAKADAAAAKEHAAELEVTAAQLRLDLERERAARLPRTVNPDQRAKLLECLKDGPRGLVIVLPKTFDEEAEVYAVQISDVLQEAKFELRQYPGQRPFGFGVACGKNHTYPT